MADDIHLALLRDMDDDALIEHARDVRKRLRALPQGSPGRDELIIAYRRVVDAINSRGLEGEV